MSATPITRDSARDRYLARFEAFVATQADAPASLDALRRNALAQFAESGFPHSKLEEWRYTNVLPLLKIPFELASASGGAGTGATREDVERVARPVFACSNFVFVDGRYREDLSAPRALAGADAIRVESLAKLMRSAPERVEPHLGQLADTKQHAFAALNTAFLEDGAVLLVPRGVQGDHPIHLVFLSTPGAAATVHHPRVLIAAEEGSHVTVIQDHATLGAGPRFSNAVTEVSVGRNARVDLVMLQRESRESFHVSNLSVRQERDSRFASHTVSFGGALVRNDLSVLLADEGADCGLFGLFSGGGDQLLDNHTLVDHALPHCTSRELYKGILAGRAKGVFRGRVIVRPDAQKTYAEQSNPNLLIGRGAEINSKPQLEIYADDVKCSHGSTTGQLDDKALFYLRSRGIGERDARELLTRGFASAILRALPVAGLAEELEEELRTLRGEVS